MKLPKTCRKTNNSIICIKNNKEINMKSCAWTLGSNAFCTDMQDERHYFKDVLFPPNTDETHKIEEKTYATFWEGFKKMHILDKDLYLSGHLSDIGETGDKLVIKSLFNKLIVREIEILSEKIVITAGGDKISLPKTLSIYYEPWFMDRGCYVFFNPSGNMHPSGQLLKLGTEGDIVEEVKS